MPRSFKKLMIFLVCILFIFSFCAKKNLRNKNEYKYVFFILIDACRADHMSLYGYKRETTPFIDFLGKKGIFFKNAYSSGNHTRISLPSIFISSPVAVHGMRDTVILEQKVVHTIWKKTNPVK